MLSQLQWLYLLAAALFTLCAVLRGLQRGGRGWLGVAVPALMGLTCAYSAFGPANETTTLLNARYMNYVALALLALTVLPGYFGPRAKDGAGAAEEQQEAEHANTTDDGH